MLKRKEHQQMTNAEKEQVKVGGKDE